jgi:hypothetical protein
MTPQTEKTLKSASRRDSALRSRPATFNRQVGRCCLLACIVISSAGGSIFAQFLADNPAPGAAKRVPALASIPGAECDGLGWPGGFPPIPRAVELPSARLGAAARPDFPANRLPILDVTPLLAEDATNQGWGSPPRVGIERPVDAAVTGAWHDLPDGGRLWTAALISAGAMEMRLHFAGMNLPSGAALYVYSPNEPEAVAGPYVEAGLLQTGDFWSGTISGDTAYVEYCVLDASQTATIPFAIDKLGHVYRTGEGDGSAGPRAWDTCMQDVACYFPTWQNTSYAVAKYTYVVGGNLYYCSGTLLATLSGDNTPYLLTSAHCIDSAAIAATVECRWFYQRATCGGSLMTSQYSNVADLLATSGAQVGPDWTLMMIRGALPSGVFWSGWTSTNPADGNWSVTVHHPGGTEKRYSRGRKYNYGSDFNLITFNEAGSVGSIYYGSSGSGIFTEGDQKLYGNASGTTGSPGCDYPDSAAAYGKFSAYYPAISGYLAAGGDDSFEPDDTCVTAKPLAAGSYPGLVVKRYGTDGSQGEDWYRLTVGGGAQLIVELTFTDSYGDINAQLYDSCGGSVVASAMGTVNNETLTYTNSGAAAAFYLRVYLTDNTRNTYDMNIQGAFLDCNGNSIADTCDISCAAPGCAGVPGCGQSQDCNGNGVPDECEGGDICAPANLHWVQVPSAISTTAITMEAQADDPSGVEYYFNATGLGSHTRNWGTNPVYTDSGLYVNRNYSYKVKARDQSPAHNETPYTDPVPVATFIETPTALSFGDITDSSIVVSAPGAFTRLTANLSGLFFEVTKLDGTPAGGSQANAWVQVQTITATGLTAGETCRFRVKARNYYGVDETPWYPASGYVNQATTSSTCQRLGDVNDDGLVNGLDVDGFIRAKLGAAPMPGENQACADYGGTLDQDIIWFVADLLGQ